MKFRNSVLLILMVAVLVLPTHIVLASENLSMGGRQGGQPTGLNITVYEDPACGCCNKWIHHLEKQGFQVKAVDTPQMNQVKQELGLPPKLASCHTGIINQRVIEGHVPANDIQELLKQKRAIAGLAVPEMPVGTPGMEMPDGQKDPFTVFSYDQHGQISAFKKYS